MTTLTVAHDAPYTVEDLADLPKNGNRYKVLEGADRDAVARLRSPVLR